MKVSINPFWHKIMSFILVLISFAFISFGIVSSVNVDAVSPIKKVSSRKVITRKVVPKVKYVESVNSCFRPTDRSYTVIKQFKSFDDFNKCNDFVKTEKERMIANTDEFKTFQEPIKVEQKSLSDLSFNSDFRNFITKINNTDNSENTLSSAISSLNTNAPNTNNSSIVSSTQPMLRYLTPNDLVGGANCTTSSNSNINKIYSCQFDANTNGTSIDNPDTSVSEYLKLAVRNFNGTQDLSISTPCYLSNGKMYCNDMNISNLAPGDYYLYFVGNHAIQWMNFGMFSVSVSGDLSTNIKELPSCGGMVNFSCDIKLNVFLTNNSSSNLESQIIRVNFPPCTNFKPNGSSTNVIYKVYGNTLDVVIPTFSSASSQGYLLLFTPNINNMQSCQYTSNGNYFTTQFTAVPILPKYFLDTNTSNNASVINVYISKSVG